MIGITNATGGGGLKGEILNLSLVSNQASHDSLLGAIITVTHPGGSTEYTWEGSEISVSIPPYVEYSVEYSKVEGYKTPESFTSTAVAGNSRNVTGTYEACKLSIGMTTNQSSHTDVANAKATVTYIEDEDGIEYDL